MISALFVVFTLNLMLICSLSVSSVRDVCRKFADGQASNLNQLHTWNSESPKVIQCNGIHSVLFIHLLSTTFGDPEMMQFEMTL